MSLDEDNAKHIAVLNDEMGQVQKIQETMGASMNTFHIKTDECLSVLKNDIDWLKKAMIFFIASIWAPIGIALLTVAVAHTEEVVRFFLK